MVKSPKPVVVKPILFDSVTQTEKSEPSPKVVEPAPAKAVLFETAA